MRDTTLSVLRAGVVRSGVDGRPATGVFAQVDQMSDEEVLKHPQLRDFSSGIIFKIYVPWYPNCLITQKDTLIDERFNDPDTGQLYSYRIIGRPKDFPFFRQVLYAWVGIGT